MDWLTSAAPNIMCLQETRTEETELPTDLAQPKDYTGYWNPSRDKRGYSGTAQLIKTHPLSVEYGLGSDEFNGEGRTITAHYLTFTLLNC